MLITHDLDFGALLAFSGDNRPSTIIFRIHNIVPHLFYQLIVDNWATIEQPLHEGALVMGLFDQIIVNNFTINLEWNFLNFPDGNS